MVRCVAIHAAYFLFRVSSGLLAVPRQDMDFESAPLFFCSVGECGCMAKQIEHKEEIKEWLSNAELATG